MRKIFQNKDSIKHIIVTVIDSIAVLGFTITAFLEVKFSNIPVWISLGFAFVAAITSIYEMYTTPVITEE
ncbi:MAG: hypothetical protein J5379_08495 [Clostridiales bacterium]|nr:hypothetical protein [Clostridiales bacterium]